MASRREVIFGGVASVALAALVRPSLAQSDWPSKPITINIGNAPGGDDDTLTRWLGETITEELGQPVVVQNKPGGSTTLAGGTVAHAKPDGYELLCLIAPGVVQTILRKDLPYTLDNFTPIISFGGYPLALITSASAGIKSLDDLYKVARSPDGITFASGGVGTLGHLTATMFLKHIGGKGVHVSYKNNPEGIQAMIGGFTQMLFASAREAALLKDEPNLRVLAVTSKERTTTLPDVPTTAELGYPAINSFSWYGYVAPAGVPSTVAEKISAAVAKGVQSKAFQDKFAPLSFQTNIRIGPDFAAFIAAEAEKFRKIIIENNIALKT